MKEEFDADRGEDEAISAILGHLRGLDGDAQLAAIFDMEKAIAGAPMIDRPLWLRGLPIEAITRARHRTTQLFETPSVPKTMPSPAPVDTLS